ncbi:MAG: caspase family protein [Flavobacteriales bacterium]|nr:caspase family protein [Flavobacteriales bacterium]
MKFQHIIPVILFATSTLVVKAQNKHALIIAIGDYDSSQGWNDISSANDIPLIRQTLLDQGFKNENIALLQDNYATSKGIDEALEKLTAKVGPKDIVVIHYSGHGQQVQDLNGDEADGYDEALVCYDAPLHAPDNYDFSRHYTDDKLGEKLYEIRQRLGKDGHLLVFLDACHSGSGTRGEKPEAQPRGTDVKCELKGYRPATTAQGDKDFVKEMGYGSRGESSGLAKFVVFSGASAHQLNYECKDDNGKAVGSLSYAIAKAFKELGTDVTYRSMFARILDIMAVKAPRQNPVLEGDIDFKVFNGMYIPQESYFEIETIEATKITLNGGYLSGLTLGDKIGFYPSGTNSITGKKPNFLGVVKSLDNYSAVVELESPQTISNKKSIWAFVIEKNFTNTKVNVRLELSDTRMISNLTNLLKDLNGINIVTTGGELKVVNRGNGFVLHTTVDDLPYLDMKPVQGTAEEVAMKLSEAIKLYAQSKFLRELQLTDESNQVSVELVPVKATVGIDQKFTVNEYIDTRGRMDDKNAMVFSKDDQFVIKAKNTGNSDVYVTVIDIQPDGRINPILVADNASNAKDLLVEAGQEKEFKVLIDGFGEPYGTEVFKIFITSKPLNLKPIIDAQGKIPSGTRGDKNPLENLFIDSYMNTRGPKIVGSIPATSSGTVTQITFRVDPNMKR